MGKFRETLAEGALHLGLEQDRVFADLTLEENKRYKSDIRATNILLQGNIARQCTRPKRQQNSKYFEANMLLMQAQENGVILDEEQLLFIVDILSEVQDHDKYLDSVDESQEVHEMHNDVQQNYVVDSDPEYTKDTLKIPEKNKKKMLEKMKSPMVVVQNVQGKHNRGQGNNARGAVAARNKGF
nr:retrovirus-related Pol polyprotein from transposon TNT 1-94 [Tanacetum cinerariifolium]